MRTRPILLTTDPDGNALAVNEPESPRLLLVDDEAALREPLAEYLSRQGFSVAQAASAAEARSLLKAEPPELVLLDIMMPGEDGHFEFEGWRLDPLKRRLIDPEGALISISSAEFRLLLAFLEHPRQVLDRDRLLDMVQGREAHLFDRAVDNQVSRLRRKIERDNRNPTLIQTVWGGGYMLAADVRRVAAGPA